MDTVVEASIPAVLGGIFSLFGVWLGHHLQNKQKAESTAVQSQANPSHMKLSIPAVIRDVGVLLLLTGIGGFIVGVARPGADIEDLTAAIAVSNILLSTIGFTISGSRTSGKRWKHLFIVAVGLWLSSLINLLFGISILLWIAAIPMILVVMGVGGATSYIFNHSWGRLDETYQSQLNMTAMPANTTLLRCGGVWWFLSASCRRPFRRAAVA